MVLRVIDIETTGTDASTEGICEIASVDIIKGELGFKLDNEQQILVHPGKPIPPVAAAVHHILDEDVAQARELKDVIDRFKGADAYVAHNSYFERSFLEEHLGESWICTYKGALRVWPDAPGHSNQVLRYWLGHKQPFGRPRNTIAPHRALSDVIVTACIFTELIKKASWADLQKWTNEPALFTRFSFGLHIGKRYDEVPADYLNWIVTKSTLAPDVKWSAQYWLDKRQAAA